jgi:hypothetical protein
MIDRRRILRGALGGGLVTVGLPLLDCFLDGNGQAMAATGRPMPVRFGTWFWGLGMQSQAFTPKGVGKDWELTSELEPLRDVRQHINVFTGFDAIKDDSPNLCHFSGWVTYRCGRFPSARNDITSESLDVTIARKIGGATRFRQLDATATGDPSDSYSFSNINSFNTPEITPAALYQRIFGAEFQDPNGSTFTKNPVAVMRQSVLSGVMEQTKALESGLGAADRARLDQYFTGLREVENQLEHQLTKPEPIEACRVPQKPEEVMAGLSSDILAQRHKIMTDLMVMAVACDQTRIFNMVYSAASANTTKTGITGTHHVTTHEEMVDTQLGYQPTTHWFTIEAMKNFDYFIKALDAVKEGDGTLLDNTLLFAHSDHEYAKLHGLEGIPSFTAGRAGGRVKTGLHIAGGSQSVTRVPYTVMRAMGVDSEAWGAKSNRTSKEIGEILA